MAGPLSSPEVLRVLSMVALGLCCGILWDFFRATSIVFSWSGWKRACADLAFWLLTILLLLRYLYTTPEFGWRLYDLATLLLGSILYFSWFSRWVLTVLIHAVTLVHRFLLNVWRFLRFLVNTLVALFTLLTRPIVWISRALYQTLRWALKILFPPSPPEEPEPPAAV